MFVIDYMGVEFYSLYSHEFYSNIEFYSNTPASIIIRPVWTPGLWFLNIWKHSTSSSHNRTNLRVSTPFACSNAVETWPRVIQQLIKLCRVEKTVSDIKHTDSLYDLWYQLSKSFVFEHSIVWQSVLFYAYLYVNQSHIKLNVNRN